MCDFTDFVTFSNAHNDTCFVTRCAIFPILSLLATPVTIPVLLNRLFGGSIHYFYKKSVFKQTFWGEHSLFLWKKPG